MCYIFFFFFNDTATTEIYTLSLHDALPIWAMLEATAYGVRHIFEVMREAGGGGERLVAVGGGTKGGVWTQIISDVTGRPQELPEQTIGASYGDALLAARSVGLVEHEADWSEIAATVEPKEENRKV